MKNRLFRYLIALVSVLAPSLVWATGQMAQSPGSLTFTPPNTDISVAFIGKIFGSMPPVLYPSDAGGMVPQMFSIFNMAVLTLGGIVLMYTLIVSTVNTAHEGEVLGKRWSSIWIPLRQVCAFALLVPTSSGYCLMQVFVMWVVLQGIGAADQLWVVGLNYLNAGGFIISAPLNNTAFNTLYTDHDQPMMKNVAGPMLTSLICMEGLRVGLTQLSGNAALINQKAIAAESADEARVTADTTYARTAVATWYSTAPTDPVKRLALEPAFFATLKTPVGGNVLTPAQIAYLTTPGTTFNVYDQTQTTNYMLALPFPPGPDPAIAAAAQVATNLPNVPDFISLSTFQGTEQDFPQASTGNPQGLDTLLSGVCGKVTWQTLTASEQVTSGSNMSGSSGQNWADIVYAGLSDADKLLAIANNATTSGNGQSGGISDSADKQAMINSLMATSRSAALIAMYNDLAEIARTIVGNFYQGVNGSPAVALGTFADDPNVTAIGNSDAGAGQVTAPNPLSYRAWVTSDATISASPLLTGQELYNAVQIYNSVMQPALSAMANGSSNTDWITNSKAGGWITAGSYFMDMAKLNDQQAAILRDNSTITVTGPGSFQINEKAAGPTTFPISATFANIVNGGTASNTTVPNSMTDNNTIALLEGFGILNPPGGPGTFYSEGEGAAAFKNLPQYMGINTGSKIVKDYFNNYLDTTHGAPSYVPPNVLGNTSTPQVPFSLGLFKLDPIQPSDCWGVFCIGGSVENVFIDLVNLLVIPPLVIFMNSAILPWTLPISAAGTMFVNQMILGAMSAGSHPILALAQGGAAFLNYAGITFTVMIAGNVAAGLFAGILIPLMDFLNPFFIFMIGVMLSFGFMFAFYAPLLPFTIFLMAAIGWMVAVIEAIVAAPLVALGLAHPEGDPILGKADPAVCMLTNVFMRPTFILLGFIFGFILSYVGVLLFNQGFGYICRAIVANVNGFGSLFAPFVLAAIYITVYMDILSKSFEMIHLLPDRALVWISCNTPGAPGQFSESGANIKGATEGAAKSAGGLAESSAKGAQNVAKKAGSGGGGGGGPEATADGNDTGASVSRDSGSSGGGSGASVGGGGGGGSGGGGGGSGGGVSGGGSGGGGGESGGGGGGSGGGGGGSGGGGGGSGGGGGGSGGGGSTPKGKGGLGSRISKAMSSVADQRNSTGGKLKPDPKDE